MNFLESITAGIAKAEESQRHIREVEEVFGRVNVQLANFPKAKLRISRSNSLQSTLVALNKALQTSKPEREFFDEDRLYLYVSKDNNEIRHDIAGWRQNIKGLPCSVKFQGCEYICQSPDDLESAFEELLSSVTVGKILSKL